MMDLDQLLRPRASGWRPRQSTCTCPDGADAEICVGKPLVVDALHAADRPVAVLELFGGEWFATALTPAGTRATSGPMTSGADAAAWAEQAAGLRPAMPAPRSDAPS